MQERYIAILLQVFTFVSAFAAVSAGIIMFKVKKKFGSGILAVGFKNIAIGVIFIALGIIVDAFSSYVQLSGFEWYPTVMILVKGIFFLLGTYIIVIGSKKTADKLESLTG